MHYRSRAAKIGDEPVRIPQPMAITWVIHNVMARDKYILLDEEASAQSRRIDTAGGIWSVPDYTKNNVSEVSNDLFECARFGWQFSGWRHLHLPISSCDG